ncbi:MAG: hypothetical protein A6F72_07055 [Cycloclasticus sp. symbiont of Poecilosclerida sp. N]|nr:MAG: hypothetical protein A6F72_07055 [Cycloclasticus sp. symbiont of Poecilosclerida sp. N]
MSKQALNAQRAYGKVARSRKDFFDKMGLNYALNNDLICLEDLNIAAMARYNGRMVQGTGWATLKSTLRRMIEHKAERYGCHVSIISLWFPSAKKCSSCGNRAKKDISDRDHQFLWTTNSKDRQTGEPFLNTSFNLLEQWGYKFYTMITWNKNTGYSPGFSLKKIK